MGQMDRVVPAVVLLAALACARRSEVIGAAGDAGAGPPGDGAGDVIPASCPSDDTPLPAVPVPAWNCQGVDRCFRTDSAIDPTVFSSRADPDPARRPVLVYPPEGALLPVNLPPITLQWRRAPGGGQVAFRLRLEPAGNPEAGVDLLVPYRAPMRIPPPPALEDVAFEIPTEIWRHIARGNAGRTLEIIVAAYDPSTATVATSARIAIRLSRTPVHDGLYFQTSMNGTINRHVFGTGRFDPLVPAGSAANRSDCGGCHSVSNDGRTLAFAATYAGDLTVAATADLTRPRVSPDPDPSAPRRADAIGLALSPDGQLVFARRLDRVVTLRDANGVELDHKSAEEMGGRIDFPEWGPGGDEIVAARAVAPAQPPESYSAIGGELVRIPIAGGRIGQPAVIASAPDEAYGNPSVSPDGNWVVFVGRPPDQPNHRNATSRFLLLDRASGAVRVLARATPNGVASTYPKFARTVQDGCSLMFIAFQSRMDYGLLRLAIDNPRWPQLWLTAIDLQRLVAEPGADPSSPPIWLPFQSMTSENSQPAWSARVPCTSGIGCGAGASCIGDRCLAD